MDTLFELSLPFLYTPFLKKKQLLIFSPWASTFKSPEKKKADFPKTDFPLDSCFILNL
jgi:hypothetical protein